MPIRTLLILVCVFSLIEAPRAAARTWTDKNGRTTTGEFVRLYDGKVVLRRGGRAITVPLKDFCESDQTYIQSLAKGGPVARATKKAAAAKDEGTDSASAPAKSAFPARQPPEASPGEESRTGQPPPEEAASSVPVTQSPASKSRVPATPIPQSAPQSPPAAKPAAAETTPKAKKSSPWPTGPFVPTVQTEDEATAAAEQATVPVTPVLKEKTCPYCKKSISPDLGPGDLCPHCRAVFTGQGSYGRGSDPAYSIDNWIWGAFIAALFLVPFLWSRGGGGGYLLWDFLVDWSNQD